MNELFLRLGVLVSATDQDIEDLKNDPSGTVVRLIKEGKVKVGGDSYFPDSDDNYPLLNGEEHELEMDFEGQIKIYVIE